MFNSSGAESFQIQYQQLVENWLTIKFPQLQQEQPKVILDQYGNPISSQQPSPTTSLADRIQVTVENQDGSERIAYGKDADNYVVCDIIPEEIQTLDQALNETSGSFVETLPPVKIDIDKKTVFQSDGSEVLLNETVSFEERLRELLGVQSPSLGMSEASDAAAQEITSAPTAALLDSEQIDEMVQPMIREPVHRQQPAELPGAVKVLLSENDEAEIIYGKAGQQVINKLASEQVESLSNAVNSSSGDVIPELAGIKVKAGDEVIFEVGENNQVLSNQPELLQQALAQFQQQPEVEKPRSIQPEYDDDYDYPEPEPDFYSSYDSEDYYPEPESATSQPQIQTQIESKRDEVLVDLMAQMVEKLPDPIQPEYEIEENQEQSLPQAEPEKQQLSIEVSAAISEPQPALHESESKNGLDVVQEAIGEMPISPLKKVLAGMADQMQSAEQQQQPDPVMDALSAARKQSPQNPNFWQKLTNKIEEVVTTARDTFTQYRAASTLKEFASQQGLQSGQTYEGAEYNLSKQGKEYTLTDKEGNHLMKFQSTVLGVKVDKSLPALDEQDFKNTEALRLDMKSDKQHQGAFIPDGKTEANHLERVTRITQALSQYASAQGGQAKVEGKFSYDWQANSVGSVMIQDKSGNVLLASAQGHVRSQMTEKDLKHFEQILPILQSSVQKMQSLQPAGKSKQMEMG